MKSNFNIFYISSEDEFRALAVEIFLYQWNNSPVYRKYCEMIGTQPSAVKDYRMIPFLPAEFFKTQDIITGNDVPEKIFFSSGTTGQVRSRHLVSSLRTYRESLKKSFEIFFGNLNEYDIFGLMPSPSENPGSSLVFMVNEWIKESGGVSGFYLDDHSGLIDHLKKNNGRKKLLIGLTYALLDLAENHKADLSDVLIMETGGMKGKRKEMIREEVHSVLKEAFNVGKVYSEYGMTELLSQAYSKGDGIFQSPPWMKILIRDTDDPFSLASEGKSGGISIIDLANVNSCSFIAVQDLGKVHSDNTFEVLGRFDNSEARGCNLMIG